MTEAEFRNIVGMNPNNVRLLDRLQPLGLRECHLTAGCLFQAVWNLRSLRAPEWGVKDYDVFYFDDSDLTWEAEARTIRQVTAATADLSIRVDTKNQARVHLWYPERFGGDYPKLAAARAGIDRYLISRTSVGIQVSTGELYAPNGLEELAAGKLRMDLRDPRPEQFRQKAESYRQRWPWLQTVD